LKNQANKLTLLDGSEIYILGLDDAMLGKPDLTSMMVGVPKERYKILLCHEPDLASQAQFYGIQLQLSGHSHGGQIQIPFIGPLVTPPLAEKYYEGFYFLENELGKLTLYVNRGIGTTRLPFRFLSQPEVTVFHLASS
jgi:predicted MPP superfamily phosphohydrolase